MRRKRRVNGEGSIYESQGSFIAQISINGALVRRRCRTEAEALAALDDLRSKRRKHINLIDRDVTFAEWFNTWLGDNRKLKTSTREGYRTLFDRYVNPYIGRYPLNELTGDLLQSWVNQLDEKNLASNTIRNVVARVRAALARAVQRRRIEYNPASGLDLPNARERRPIALDEDEARALLDAVADHRLYALYVLALSLGMRQGELLGLTWKDIDWRDRTITVQRTLRRVGRKITIDSTKTNASDRVIALSDNLVEVLREHQRSQEEERALEARRGNPHWNDGTNRFVFCSERGTALAARNLLRQFESVKQRAKLPKMRFHDLRHTAGSLMLLRGTDMIDVSRILGHSSPMVTAKIYAHSYKDRRRRATDDLAGALLRRKAQ